jgi:hypothetical protein
MLTNRKGREWGLQRKKYNGIENVSHKGRQKRKYIDGKTREKTL